LADDAFIHEQSSPGVRSEGKASAGRFAASIERLEGAQSLSHILSKTDAHDHLRQVSLQLGLILGTTTYPKRVSYILVDACVVDVLLGPRKAPKAPCSWLWWRSCTHKLALFRHKCWQ